LKTPKKDTRSQIEEFLPVDNCELNDGTRASNDQVISERIIRPGSANSALHNFMPATKLKGMEDYVEEEDQFKYLEQDNEFVVHKENDERLVYPKILKAFMFPRGDVSKFPQPKRSSLGTSSSIHQEHFQFLRLIIYFLRLFLNGCCISASSFSSESRTK